MGKNYSFFNKKISGILSVVPSKTVKFEFELANYGFTKEKSLNLKRIMGFDERRVVEGDECTSDLLLFGLEFLINNNQIQLEDIGALVLVTQTPDHFMPPTSSILHGKLGLDQDVLCFDINQGCTGYLCGLIQSFMLLEILKDKKVLLLNGDTLSRCSCPFDRNIYPIIGDAGTVTVVENTLENLNIFFNLKTDGTRSNWLIIPAGAFRMPTTEKTREIKTLPDGNRRSDNDFFMDGAGIFNFVQSDVPPTIKELFDFAKMEMESIDYFMFHQPNRFLLDKLAGKIKIPKEKIPTNLVEKYGNSSSATIPVTICDNIGDLLLKTKKKICMAGFGVGLSWGTAIMDLGPLDFCDLIEK